MTTTLARYVYVYLEGDDRTLTLCELEVYGHRGRHPIFQYTVEHYFHKYAVFIWSILFLLDYYGYFLWLPMILEYSCIIVDVLM